MKLKNIDLRKCKCGHTLDVHIFTGPNPETGDCEPEGCGVEGCECKYPELVREC